MLTPGVWGRRTGYGIFEFVPQRPVWAPGTRGIGPCVGSEGTRTVCVLCRYPLRETFSVPKRRKDLSTETKGLRERLPRDLMS